jgi:OmpA-OmpF porin, OOP family
MKKKTLLAAAAFAVLAAPTAHAQPTAQGTTGFNADRFNPSERGSEWFALDTLDLRGSLRPAAGIVFDYANHPFTVDGQNGSRQVVVSDQAFLHAGISLVVLDRVRLGLNLPVGIVDSGNGATGSTGTVFPAPSKVALGDMRIGADLRLVGEYGKPFTAAIGGQVFVPTGESKQYTSDDQSHGIVRVQAAGDAGVFVYSLLLGVDFHAAQTTINGAPYGSSVVYGAAAGVRVADRKLVIGPEVYGSSVYANTTLFSSGTTAAEGVLGVHYTIGQDWRIGAAAGPGFSRDLGSPLFRILGVVEWAPHYVPPPPPDRDHDGIPDAQDACPDKPGVPTDDPATNGCPPPPSDRDHDGIPDADDACPDKPGPKTDDPKTNGCPPPSDRDGDGIIDEEDACPDVKGVKTDDPKTNGCPPDKDKDGVPDAEDACPDVPGVKTDDPKTNGCPPDRDGDGIVDSEDACPDAPGPHTDDPKTNGCPKAAVVNGMIKISEQVKFATGSAKILKDSDELLNAVADVFGKHPEITMVRIEGHTDNVGKPAFNKKLSQSRADSVKAWLVKHGIDKKRMTTQGFGQEKPIDTNDTPEGRQNNRRVEFHIEQGAQAPAPPPAGAAPGAPATPAPGTPAPSPKP